MHLLRQLILIAIILQLPCKASAAEGQKWPALLPALHVAHAAEAPMLAAARAGKRVVAVGDHGAILLSDDGAYFRQAKAVPVRAMLTTVQFLDDRIGYAAGHDGVVLGTRDGGETWGLLRATPGVEQPILSLYFDSANHGIAVGLYGWMIETRDGGRTWAERHVGSGDNSDRHLYHVFASAQGTLLVAGEAGTIYRSADGGQGWDTITVGNQGSLWHGALLDDGTLLICGMRGRLYRSRDDGRSWQEVRSGTTQSLTGVAPQAGGGAVVIGMSGTILRSADAGMTFALSQRPEREPLTAVVTSGDRQLVLLSLAGRVAP